MRRLWAILSYSSVAAHFWKDRHRAHGDIEHTAGRTRRAGCAGRSSHQNRVAGVTAEEAGTEKGSGAEKGSFDNYSIKVNDPFSIALHGTGAGRGWWWERPLILREWRTARAVSSLRVRPDRQLSGACPVCGTGKA